jgi:ketosteroid isomerase-like protein
MRLTTLSIAVIITVGFISCSQKQPVNALSLIDTDRYYSALSEEKGRNEAFLALFDSSGVMLSPHRLPLEGYNAICKLLLSRSDSSYILTWKPMFSKVAQSGELGYTYGTYKLTDRKSKKLMEEGTYATFWKKNTKGEWKALLDTGNEGLK